jgi:hypothetical protein
MRPVDTWSMTFLASILTMKNYAIGDTAALIDFLTLSLGTTQAIVLSRDDLVRSGSLSYTFQRSADGNPLRSNKASSSHTVTTYVTMSPAEDLSLVPSVSVAASRVGGQPWTRIETFTVSAQHRALENALSTSLTLGLSTSQSTSSLQTNLSAMYRIAQSNSLTLSIRRTGFQGNPGVSTDYSEYTASLTMSQRL